MQDLKTLNDLPLSQVHQKAGAKFCAFAGWSMPVSYKLGVLKEHLAVRSYAGIFDISHMKLFEISGPDASNFMAYALPLDINFFSKGQSKYSFLLNEEAGILDDLIITRLEDNLYLVVVNAANAEKDYNHFKSRSNGFECKIQKLDTVILALQGPESAALLQKLQKPFDHLNFMQGCKTDDGWFVTRSGYTGEDGFEIALSLEQAKDLIFELFKDSALTWVGLGARDSLRLEAGLCLHGVDISEKVTPIDANLMFPFSAFLREKGSFIGASALRKKMKLGSLLKRVGLKVHGRQPLRNGVELFFQDTKIGSITSGGYGPSVQGPVAMGYVARHLSNVGTVLKARAYNKEYDVEVSNLPFFPHRYKR